MSLKAIEILKTLKEAKTFVDYGVIFDGNAKARLSEAIEELEDLNSRSCKNCNDAIYSFDNLECRKEYSITYGRNVSKNFCCNKWNLKQNDS